MKKEILCMVENYEMGFISPKEFLNQYADLLSYLGFAKDLEDRMNDLLSPLSSFVSKKLKEGEHFSIVEFDNL